MRREREATASEPAHRLTAPGVEVAPDIAADLRAYVPLVGFVAEVFGDETEVVLHDVRDLNRTVVVIVNGGLSGRRLRDSATDFILTVLGTKDLKERDYLVEYESRARNGALFRSSAFFLRDEDGEIAAMLSINIELQRLLQAKELFQRLTRTSPVAGGTKVERMNITPKEMTREAIDAELAAVGIHPSAMTPADKFRVIQGLYEKGIFLMRRSVPRAAKALMLSEPSIYRYLTAVRAEAGQRSED